MATTLAELILLGLLADWVFRKFSLPGLIGMLLLGVGLGPYVLNWISPETMAISADLRMICLIVILLRAGFEMSWETLKKMGRPALLLAFVPAVFEGVAVTLLGPALLHMGYLESAILGTVLSAVSPAVVVPLMIRFIEEGRGVTPGARRAHDHGHTLFDELLHVPLIIKLPGNTGGGRRCRCRHRPR